jgi:hypothetical protein
MTKESDAYFQAEITRLKAIIERMQGQIDRLIFDIHNIKTRGSDE